MLSMNYLENVQKWFFQLPLLSRSYGRQTEARIW